MKRKFALPIAIAFTFICGVAFGQEINREKIIGCWTLKSVTSMEIDGDVSALPYFTRNAVSCFAEKGTFSLQLPNGQHKRTSRYYFSEDGTGLNLEWDADHSDTDFKVISIGERQLELQTGDFVLVFDKVLK